MEKITSSNNSCIMSCSQVHHFHTSYQMEMIANDMEGKSGEAARFHTAAPGHIPACEVCAQWGPSLDVGGQLYFDKFSRCF